MTPEALAALHARCFADTPPPWSAAAFASVLAEPSTLAALRADGFALGRVAGGEAELLTLAVAPEARRRGVGRALVATFETEAVGRGGREAFLEVAESNAAARALYASLGYAAAGRRRGYFARAGAPAVDAIVMRKSLSALCEKASASGKTD